MSVSITVTGIEELKAAINALPQATGKAVIRRILKKHAQTIAARARQLVPVKSGRLARSLRVTIVPGETASEIAAFVGTRVFYGRFQEFGTQHQPPHAFLRPALDETKQQVLDGIRADLWAEIKKAVERLSRKQAKD